MITSASQAMPPSHSGPARTLQPPLQAGQINAALRSFYRVQDGIPFFPLGWGGALMSLLMRVVGTGGGSGGGGGYGLVKEDMEICLHVIHLIQALIEDGSASGGGAENIDLFLK
eukprot:845102-Amorphochlora_amoeboformis.AAC.1